MNHKLQPVFNTVMFKGSFSQFPISENQNTEFYELCNELKSKKVKNSPWEPFFDQRRHSEIERTIYNIYEISEMSEDETGEEHVGNNIICTSASEEEPMNREGTSANTDSSIEILEDQLLQLKQVLLDIKMDCPLEQCLPEIAVFGTISPTQIPLACEILQLSTVNEGAVAVVLNSLSCLEPAISLITAASITHYAIHSKIKNWTLKGQSRALPISILSFTKKYPKAVIDELILPCLKDESLNTTQAEFLQNIISNGLTEDHVLYCLRESMEISSPNESAVTAIHSLLERRAAVDDSLCHMLTGRIYNWSTAFNSNLPFSKLLKSLISIYGNQMTEEQISTLAIVVQNNKTAFKRPLENLLKKL